MPSSNSSAELSNEILGMANLRCITLLLFKNKHPKNGKPIDRMIIATFSPKSTLTARQCYPV